MIKINIVILTLILLVGVVFAGDYWVDDNLNMLGNDVHNATNIYADRYLEK